ASPRGCWRAADGAWYPSAGATAARPGRARLARRLAAVLRAIWRRRPAGPPPRPALDDPSPPDPAPSPKMPTLVEQMIPPGKLLLMGSESILITGILFFGSCLPPLSHAFADVPFVPNLLRCLLTSFTIAVICQTSLSYNDLYDWRTAQNRAELPNRLLHACG